MFGVSYEKCKRLDESVENCNYSGFQTDVYKLIMIINKIYMGVREISIIHHF